MKRRRKKWGHLKARVSDIADDAVETSEELIAKSKVAGEELKETYHRISERLSK